MSMSRPAGSLWGGAGTCGGGSLLPKKATPPRAGEVAYSLNAHPIPHVICKDPYVFPVIKSEPEPAAADALRKKSAE